MKRALITGINGQDGSYLAELLLEKGYSVHGTLKRNSVVENQTARIDHIIDDLDLHYADMIDTSSLISVIKKVQPDEIYNLAAQSHVRISFDEPIYTMQVTGIGFLNLLEAVRLTNPDIKVYQASSSEMFGNNVDEDGYQRETTPLNPVSPYGCAKTLAYNVGRNYRNSYGMFISNGILFNHESPRRGTNFVSNKICKGAVEIKLAIENGLEPNKLVLGNLEAGRDWGHAKDYVNAMWLMLQHHTPDDYVCATGTTHTVREMCDYVFSYLNLNYKEHVVQHEKYFRPEDVEYLKGDSSKLTNELGWKREYTFETMLDEMIEYWLEKL